MEPIDEQLNRKLKENTLRVPENYFEQLEQDILNKTMLVKQEEITAEKKAPVLKRLIIITSIAATIVAVYMGVTFMANKNQSLEIQLAKMSAHEIDTYMEEQIAAISYDELYGYLATNVDELSVSEVYGHTFSDAAVGEASLTDEINNQVIVPEGAGGEILLKESTEGTLLDSVDEELLQEYLNDATLFEHLGL